MKTPLHTERGFRQVYDLGDPKDRGQLNFYFKSDDFVVYETDKDESPYLRTYTIHEVIKDDKGEVMYTYI